MLKVGITGGIGSGKSVVAKIFAVLGTPVLNADNLAKMLMESDPDVGSQLIAAFGEESFIEKKLNRTYLAKMVFDNQANLQKLNNIVHPAVIAYGKMWMDKQKGPYAVKEAALFFESGSYKEMDVMIGVFAPEALRISRVLSRDRTAEEDIRKRMAAQLPEEEKMARCNYIVTNDGHQALIPQVLSLHHKFLIAEPA